MRHHPARQEPHLHRLATAGRLALHATNAAPFTAPDADDEHAAAAADDSVGDDADANADADAGEGTRARGRQHARTRSGGDGSSGHANGHADPLGGVTRALLSSRRRPPTQQPSTALGRLGPTPAQPSVASAPASAAVAASRGQRRSGRQQREVTV